MSSFYRFLSPVFELKNGEYIHYPQNFDSTFIFFYLIVYELSKQYKILKYIVDSDIDLSFILFC